MLFFILPLPELPESILSFSIGPSVRLSLGSSHLQYVPRLQAFSIFSNQICLCYLDGDNCLNLAGILQSFSGPITEQHAWAIVHQVK